MNDERSICAVVPVKRPEMGKSRLAGILDAAGRRELCERLAHRTIRACVAAFGERQTIVVTASREIALVAARQGVAVVEETDPGQGLNAALELGAAHAVRAGGDALLVVPTDLPLITREALVAAGEKIRSSPGVLIVPDRHRLGTNLMGLAPMRADLFAFGDDSLRRHAELARRASLEVCIHADERLALDLDSPADYLFWIDHRPMLEDQAAA